MAENRGFRMRASHSSPSVCSSQLSLHGVTKRYGDRTVLDQVAFSLAPGEKAGVVGDNGAGKSTLLRLLAGEERPDAGEMTVAAPGGRGYLAQTLSLPAQATVQDAVDLALAATLASRPELLLLDEPTNDLDDRAVGWLEEHLRAHRGTIVAVTHDRVFLERITTTVLEIDGGRVSRHGNGYAGYLTAKAAERRRRQQQYDQWRAELDRSRRLAKAGVTRLDGIPRKMPKASFGHGGFRMRGRAHGAMSRIRNAKERVERLTTNPVAPPPQALSFTARIATAGRPGKAPAAQLDGVVVDGRLHVPQLRLDPAERLLVTGANGAGKSTLLRVLAGELRPDAGAVSVPGRVGHLRQEEWPWPPGLTVLEAFAHGRGGDRDEHADRLLSLGLFDPEALRLRVGELSYGQRRRIELARLVSEPVDLLLLDEPTNHLSPALVEELEEALAGYAGALVIVTHDRRMRTRFTGSRLELREGAVAVGH
jgi:macrolide transport system ATP-binding/permease protein